MNAAVVWGPPGPCGQISQLPRAGRNISTIASVAGFGEWALNLVVRILGAGNAEQAQIAFDQEVVALNATLEALITGAKNEPGPGVASPDVSRELVNDFNPYYQAVTLQTPETGNSFQRFVFGMVFGGALHLASAERKHHLDELAASLNVPATNFADLIAKGAGVCRIRLALLAMTLPQAPGSPTPLIAFTELPEPPALRALADEQLRQTVVAFNSTSIRCSLLSQIEPAGAG